MTSWAYVCLPRFTSSVLYYLAAPFRRRGSGQESTPIVLLFLRHNRSYLGMELSSIFCILAPKCGERTIEIHRREGEQSKEDFLVNQREKVRYPII